MKRDSTLSLNFGNLKGALHLGPNSVADSDCFAADDLAESSLYKGGT